MTILRSFWLPLLNPTPTIPAFLSRHLCTSVRAFLHTNIKKLLGTTVSPHQFPYETRLVVPGGLDCAVLEFTRENIPDELRDRKIFFYDFRSAIRLSEKETLYLAGQLAEKLNLNPSNIKVLIPAGGWSEADRKDGPLHDPTISNAFIQRLKHDLNSRIEVKEANLHINDPAFARLASKVMVGMLKDKGQKF
jgi:uncharacterized protein (UPF0261 family)